MTRLRDLDAELLDYKEENGRKSANLVYMCPVCINNPILGMRHSIKTPITNGPAHEVSYEPKFYYKNGTEAKRYVWEAHGVFPDSFTLTPSINIVERDENGNVVRTICWHGFISNGNIT